QATGMIGPVAVRIGDTVDQHASRQTTPESLDVQRLLRQMVAAGVETAIIEATSHGLDLHRLDHVLFNVGAVTNITHEHLEHHKTITAYRRAKAILFERVAAAGGTAVINTDDEGAKEMLAYTHGADVLTYAIDAGSRNANLTASHIASDRQGSRFEIRLGDQSAHVSLPLIGRFNIANALCATGICLALNMPLPDIAAHLGAVPHIPGRMAPVNAGQPFLVIVDYAHTPESLTKVLELLRALNPTGRIITVFGSAGERDTEKRPRQGYAAATLADIVVVTDEDPRHEDSNQIIGQIAAGARHGGARDGESLYEIPDRVTAIHHAIALAKPGDQVLLAGKGHEGSIIVGTEKRPWDETAVALTALRSLGWDDR
ncbi:MAG: Mur ligase family protein, partial [Thermomicrobiales bacterium]